MFTAFGTWGPSASDGHDQRMSVSAIASLATERPNIATRKASQLVIDGLADALPNLLGGRTRDRYEGWRRDT